MGAAISIHLHIFGKRESVCRYAFVRAGDDGSMSQDVYILWLYPAAIPCLSDAGMKIEQ
jgi:hypothetical protein